MSTSCLKSRNIPINKINLKEKVDDLKHIRFCYLLRNIVRVLINIFLYLQKPYFTCCVILIQVKSKRKCATDLLFGKIVYSAQYIIIGNNGLNHRVVL